MNSIAALHTAVQARFYKSSKLHVDFCTQKLLNSVDGLKLSELPHLARHFWNNAPPASNITKGSRGAFLPGHEDDHELAELRQLHINREEGTPQSNVYRALLPKLYTHDVTSTIGAR